MKGIAIIGMGDIGKRVLALELTHSTHIPIVITENKQLQKDDPFEQSIPFVVSKIKEDEPIITGKENRRKKRARERELKKFKNK